MKILIALFLFTPFLSYPQKVLLPEKDGKVVFEEIDSISGATKADLYSKSKIWFINSFTSAKEVLQLEDEKSGQLIGKGNFKYLYTILMTSAEWICSFSVQIDCRDNKARIKIYDISSRSGGGATAEYFNGHPGNSQKHIKAISENMRGLLNDFKSSISKQTTDTF